MSARLVKPIEWHDGADYWPTGFIMGDELLRYVRSL